MASIKTLRSGGFQLCVKNKLLPKPLWATFDTYDQAKQYGDQLERLLGQDIVPAALLEHEPPRRTAWTIGRCIVEYVRNNPVPGRSVRAGGPAGRHRVGTGRPRRPHDRHIRRRAGRAVRCRLFPEDYVRPFRRSQAIGREYVCSPEWRRAPTSACRYRNLLTHVARVNIIRRRYR